MKRLIFILMILLLCPLVRAEFPHTSQGSSYWWTGGNVATDVARGWAIEIDNMVMGTRGTGSSWYADSGVTDEGDGTSWTDAFNTLDEAINACSTDGGANRGDVIYVAQGHAETFTAADGWDADVAGISIIGCGYGDNRPTFTLNHADASVTLGDSGVLLYNVRIVSSITAVTMGISVEAAADDCAIIGCEFPEPAASASEVVRMILVAAGADRLTVANCIAYSADAVGATNFIDLDTGVQNGTMIIGNRIYGEYAEGPIHSDDIDLEVCVWGNRVTNMTTGQHGIEFTAAATGIIGENWVYTDAEATSIDPGSLKAVAPNWITTAIDASPVMFPAQDDTAQNLIGVDDNNNAADTSNVASNHDGSILERLEGIYLAVNDANAIAEHTYASTPENDTLGGYVGYDDNNNAAETATVVSNHDGSILERLEGIYLAVNDANALAQHAILTPANDTIAGYIGFDDNNNAADTSNVVSNHAGSILERLEGIHLEIHDTNNIDTDVLGTPVTDSFASFIASGGTALGTNLGASASIVDAIGSTGVDLIDSTVGIGGAIGYNDNDNAMVTSSVVSNHDGSVYERLEGIYLAVNDANALTQHAMPATPLNDSIAGMIGFDDNNNNGETDNVVSNHDGSILERLEGIYLAVNDGNNITEHTYASTPENDTLGGYIGYDDADNAADTSTVVSNHDGSILERLEGIILEVRDANALTQQAIAAPINDSIAGMIGFDDNNNAMDTSTVVSNHDGSIIERLEGIILEVRDANALTQQAIAAPINDSIAGMLGFDDNNNAMDTSTVVSNHDGSVFERLEGIYLAVNDANAMVAHAMASAPINDSIAGLIGYDDADNAADTATVVSNHDGSILERLEGIYLAINDCNAMAQHAIAAPINDSIAGYIGFDDNNNAADTSTVIANADGSILERLEQIDVDTSEIAADTAAMDTAGEIQALVDPNYVIHDAVRIISDLTGNFSAADYQVADSPVTIFTVTGDIVARLTAIVNTNCTSTATTGTLEVGVVGDTACLLLQDTVDGTAFQQNMVWTLTQAPDTPSAELSGAWVVIPNSLDINVTIATNDMTAGVIEFYLEWKPLSSGATVVGAAP